MNTQAFGRVAPMLFIQWCDHPCGRYFIDPLDPEINGYRQAVPSFYDLPHGEIMPTDNAVVLAGLGPSARLTPTVMVWGFPRFRGTVAFNVRVETLEYYPHYPRYLRSLPLAIPSNGLLGWQEGRRVLLRLPGESVLYIAGIGATVMRDRDGRGPHRFALLSRPAPVGLAQFHDRVPLVLRREELGAWLGGEEAEYFMGREPLGLDTMDTPF